MIADHSVKKIGKKNAKKSHEKISLYFSIKGSLKKLLKKKVYKKFCTKQKSLKNFAENKNLEINDRREYFTFLQILLKI